MVLCGVSQKDPNPLYSIVPGSCGSVLCTLAGELASGVAYLGEHGRAERQSLCASQPVWDVHSLLVHTGEAMSTGACRPHV
eukprot:SAG11_NODE_1068_length_5979_cov_9.282653_2_plen_81_part_00